MSKYIDALQQARLEIRRLYWLCLILLAVMAFAMWGWKSAPRHLTAHIPPDLRNGATINVGSAPDVPDTTAYTFAFYIWQQLNRWQGDGAKDYGAQIYAMQNYLTPACREQLVADMNMRSGAGELFRRTRSVMEIPGLGYTHERVVVLGGSSWKVLLDAQVQETQNGVPIKDTYIRYPLRVVRYDIDREANPWQLAIDCFGGERPARLDTKAVEVAQSGRSLVAVRDARAALTSPMSAVAADPAAQPGVAPVTPLPVAPSAPASGASHSRAAIEAPAGTNKAPPAATQAITPTSLPRPL